MRRDLGTYVLILSILFLMISIVYFKPLPENYITWLLIGLTFLLAVILFIARKGILPTILITKHLPLPLALFSPGQGRLGHLFEKRILPAVQATIELTESESSEKAYIVIKHVREFFANELKGVSITNTESVRKKLEKDGMYSYIDNENERKDFQYSLASLIHWIARYRNLAMHSSKISADPIDAWFALRTALIYIRDKYPVKRTVLYTKCPKCKTTNKLNLYEGKISWLQEITIQCNECGNNYKIKVNPKLVLEHYRIMTSL